MSVLIAFDCDGTLVDSQYMIAAAMQAAFDRHGLGIAPPERVRRVVGLSLVEAIARLLPTHGAHQVAEVAETYKQAFLALRTDRRLAEPLYPGMLAVLEALSARGVLLAVCTGKSRRGLDAVLAHHGIARLFVSLQTADRHPGKPDPAMLHAAMRETGVTAQRTVLVGDTSYDMELARNAGAHALGVAWGYHPPDELAAAGAQAVVTDASDIPAAADHLLGTDA
jgi:phosphoglycolate phosphatase